MAGRQRVRDSRQLSGCLPRDNFILQSCFGRPLNNPARQSLRKIVGVPKVDATKCPRLDRLVKGSVSRDTKDADATLAKIQTLVLDTVAPLVHILESARSGQLTTDTSEKASKLALQLLANASAYISKERHKNALKDLNKNLLTLTEEDKRFANVTPVLFGDDFEKTMKEHMEAMRCIRKSSGAKMTESFFFLERPPPGSVPQQPPPQGWQQLQGPWPVPTLLPQP